MNNEELIDLCAFRYALGRRTYIVDVVTTHLYYKVESYSINMLKRLQEEIRNAPSLGDDCDKYLWDMLLEEVEDELDNRRDAREV